MWKARHIDDRHMEGAGGWSREHALTRSVIGVVEHRSQRLVALESLAKALVQRAAIERSQHVGGDEHVVDGAAG
jgi:hypothetical protein